MSKSKDGRHVYCRECSSQKSREYRTQNSAALKAYDHAYKKQHRAEINAYRRRTKSRYYLSESYLASKAKYRSKNKLQEQASNREREKRYCDELHDVYVLRVICKQTQLRKQDIPTELIELKREQLRTNRLLADLKSAIQGDPK